MSGRKLFASHAWGKDGATHARVREVVTQLKERGWEVWFDETHMRGNILDAMCEGIESADAVLIFVTEAYMHKVASGDERDNVRREFMYATTHRANRLIPIRFDPLPTPWKGPLAMILGSHLYVDMADPTVRSADALDSAARNLLDGAKTPRPQRVAPKLVPPSSALPTPGPCKSPESGPRPTRNSEPNDAPQPLTPKQFSFSTLPEVHRRPSERMPMRSPSNDPKPVRLRAARIFAATGDCPNPNEHVGAAIDRLLRSITASTPSVAMLPLNAKLHRLECELGIEAS